jgi:Family of unknown function (DUF6328)
MLSALRCRPEPRHIPLCTTSMNRFPSPKKVDQMLTEARVILPGAQALLGFQLSVVLTSAFEWFSGLSQMSHAMALGLVALATIPLMAPAAYHRIVDAGEAQALLPSPLWQTVSGLKERRRGKGSGRSYERDRATRADMA